jgi:hypothetical protein
MKKFLFGSWLLLFLVAIITPTVAAEVTSTNLVFQGYQGRLLNQGIPSYATFLQSVYLGKIDAKTLIQSAIANGSLDPEMANNESYLRQVNYALFSLRTNGSSR